jgi:hypothetical protein
MTDQELQLLKTAVATIADPVGNWNYGWEIICNLAGLNHKDYPPPFRHGSEEELLRLAKASHRKASNDPHG